MVWKQNFVTALDEAYEEDGPAGVGAVVLFHLMMDHMRWVFWLPLWVLGNFVYAIREMRYE